MYKARPLIFEQWQVETRRGSSVRIITLKCRLLLATLLLVTSPWVAADTLASEDLAWLKIMAFAAHKTDYVGTFVYQYGNHVETSRITHISDQDGDHGRLEGLDGNQREIIHSNDQVWSNEGGRRMKVGYRHDKSAFPAVLPEQWALLSENYRIKKVEEDRVAGFPTQAFIFEPKDGLRYTHKMWAHSDSGLLLKVAVLDKRGRIIEQYAFTQLTIGGNIDRNWMPHEKSTSAFCAVDQYIVQASKVSGVASSNGWHVGSLPKGFKKTLEMQRTFHGKDTPVIHLVYSDGLAGISVFIEDMNSKAVLTGGLTSQGAIQVYSKVKEDHIVTVVGEIPPTTLMQIADSIRYQGQ